MKSTIRNVLVLGATGPQGRPVAEKLMAAGFKVRLLVRNPAKAEELARAGAEILVGDLEDRASVEKAMEGQDGVFLLVSFFTGQLKHAQTVIDAAVKHGVQQLIWNATGPIVPVDTGNPSIDIRRKIHAALEQSGLPFVALQPTVYMENFLIPFIAAEVASQDVLAYPMPEAVQCQWISHLDAAAYVVAALDRASRENLTIDISGPERLSGSQIAERFSRALGREITFRPMPPKEFAAGFSMGGNEEAITSYYEGVYANPDLMTTNVDFQRAMELLPIQPTSIEDFARIYRGYLSKKS